jgi:hypothetical protein
MQSWTICGQHFEIFTINLVRPPVDVQTLIVSTCGFAPTKWMLNFSIIVTTLIAQEIAQETSSLIKVSHIFCFPSLQPVSLLQVSVSVHEYNAYHLDIDSYSTSTSSCTSPCSISYLPSHLLMKHARRSFVIRRPLLGRYLPTCMVDLISDKSDHLYKT